MEQTHQLENNYAVPQGDTDNSARVDESSQQLEFAFPDTPADLPDRAFDDEGPVIRRLPIRAIKSVTQWALMMAEGIALSSHQSRRSNDLNSQIRDAFFRFVSSAREELKYTAHPVAMSVTLGLPFRNKEIFHRPTFRPVFRFGPKARAPPWKIPTELHQATCCHST
ncbi:hypothetical protein [Massilia sp. CFBP9026]|uniref:hypothetical protein n=1 Tax=Massilia sp. CFBP9026 TaxID=3096536 RepID=UPI002A69D743|nr:hypothetical protein [Massilia sp. CFBP9026]MDY0961231.1 hypothetical protein [Massilia sp. CFBP9026]